MLIRVRSPAITVPVRAARAWNAMIPGTWVTCVAGRRCTTSRATAEKVE